MSWRSPMSNRIEYATPCPNCKAEGQTYHLGFNLDEGKIECDSPKHHFFEEIPGENAPVLGEILPHESHETEEVLASEPERTAEEGSERIAELARAMKPM